MEYRDVPNRQAGKVDVATGIRLWREVRIEATDYHGMDLDVTVTWSEDRRRLVVSKVEVRQRSSGEPITSEMLREIALGAFVRNSITQSVRDGLTKDGGADYESRVAFGLLKAVDRDRLRSQGPRDETLEWVARLYAVALAVGDSPTKAVRETFEVSQSTAGAWVSAARKAGLLGSNQTPGKAQA